jgi:2,3,4,5-tetrahydropyridine-2-carboxylate N-succinyltransferase
MILIVYRVFLIYRKNMENLAEITAREKEVIEQAWENKSNLVDFFELAPVIEKILHQLDIGLIRVAEKKEDTWQVNTWVKKAILLSFRTKNMNLIEGGPRQSYWFDKVDPKFSEWDKDKFSEAGFRAVPGSFIRHSAYIAKNVVLMPCFVNVGAYIDEGTMVDTWVTIGSCAQIGKNCHISGGVGIGGVLEPLQANPVIIEDNCFIGARSEVAEGVIIEEGSVLSMGVYLGASTKIIDRETGEIYYGRVPKYSVVVPGTIPGKNLPNGLPGPSLYAAVIVKKVDEKTRSKTSINDLLREYVV